MDWLLNRLGVNRYRVIPVNMQSISAELFRPVFTEASRSKIPVNDRSAPGYFGHHRAAVCWPLHPSRPHRTLCQLFADHCTPLVHSTLSTVCWPRHPSRPQHFVNCLLTTAPFSSTENTLSTVCWPRHPSRPHRALCQLFADHCTFLVHSTLSTAFLMQPRTSARRRLRWCTNVLHEKPTVILKESSTAPTSKQWKTA